MKKRTARKVFNRVSSDYPAIKRYKMSTVARALTLCVGMECKPKDAFVVCGLAHLVAKGALDPFIQQTDQELAS